MQVIDKTWLATVGRSCFLNVSLRKRGEVSEIWAEGFTLSGTWEKLEFIILLVSFIRSLIRMRCKRGIFI